MWPDRRLTELFEIEHPLVLAPMAGLRTVGLAASVCEAGGLGSIGCATMQPQLVAKTIQELRVQDALALPIFDGGNMGVRRRQLHNLLKRPDYDALLASGTFESSGGC